MSPLPTRPKKLPDGQGDQGYGVVLHDQGEGYQQTKLLEVGVACSSGCQGGVPFPNSLGPKFHKLPSNRSNSIPWA